MFNNIKIASIIGLVLLFLALLNLPYEYYIFLRWAITIIALFITFVIWDKLENMKWMSVIIAIIYNPIVPVYLSRNVWILIDILSGLIFLIILFMYKKRAAQ